MTRRFIKKPLEIEAFRLGHDIEPPWIFEALIERKDVSGYTDKATGERSIEIKTLEGTMTANEGDYIIKGIKGELYPCKSDIFEESYQEVNAPFIAKADALFDATGFKTPSVLIPISDDGV